MSNDSGSSDELSEREVDELLEKPFGGENRARLLNLYFQGRGQLSPIDAWRDVYRLLLWIDSTTGLAHIYESDKSQPGRPWYARAMAFHAWISEQFGVPPIQLAGEIDWLFKQVIIDLIALVDSLLKEKRAETARSQRMGFSAIEMPEPGLDSEITSIVQEHLARFVREPPPESVWREMTKRIVAHVQNKNKRQNILGEGFEDVVKAIMDRLPITAPLSIDTRVRIENIPGFAEPGSKDKGKPVDLVIVNRRTKHRTLVSAKWSVRADREEQVASEFVSYASLNKGDTFDFIFLTNEFDQARLSTACNRTFYNSPVFTHVVHTNPEGLLVAYGNKPNKTQQEVAGLIRRKRIISLADWLASFTV